MRLGIYRLDLRLLDDYAVELYFSNKVWPLMINGVSSSWKIVKEAESCYLIEYSDVVLGSYGTFDAAKDNLIDIVTGGLTAAE